jgi:transposase
MAGSLLSVSKAKEIKRLIELNLSERAIARALNCSRKTVKKYQHQSSIISSKEPSWINLINWKDIHSQAINGVPLQLLWEELNDHQQISVQYSGFWKQYHKRYPNLPVTMVRNFSPGDRIEIDYCDGLEILDPATGEILKTQLFVGVLCYSRYTYAEFTWTQKSEDFLNSHVNMFKYFGGVTQTITPDNLKSAVNKTHTFDPEINQSYYRLAKHYNTAVTPARVRRPQDKAIVERTIQIFQRWFFFKVRRRTFTSLIELNNCLHEHLKIFHEKKHRILKKSRHELFEKERESLIPLPAEPYIVSTHKKAKVHHDCHLQFENNFYSAPWNLRGKILDVWAGPRTVEIYDQLERVAFHSRSKSGGGRFITDKNHYPPEHQAYLEITPLFLKKKASQIGSNTESLLTILFSNTHPLRHLRRAQGIIALAKKYNNEKLEAACEQAIKLEKYTVQFLERVIKNMDLIQKSPLQVQRGVNPHLRGETLFKGVKND